MGYEDFTTYDETDEVGNVTVISSKVSWATLSRNHTSHVSRSKGSNHFRRDFEHLFEIQLSNVVSSPVICFWALANVQLDLKALRDAGGDGAQLLHYQSARLELHVLENGSYTRDIWASASANTTYYVTLARDDDGGANSTGQYTAEIRTGSHTGTLKDTLTVDCAAGEQNDFEYIFGLMSYDDNSPSWADGFTQNMDLQDISLFRRRMEAE